MIKIKEYEIIEELGRGGMATVYKARQPALGRFIAIKVLPPYFAHDEEFVQRFKREALAVAKLRHPNIVQVYNFHQEDDLFYLAMEYIEGGSLADLLEAEGPLSLQLSASIVKQTAAALDHAHQKGFIHRDIKPSNILLTSDRQAVLTDFGITKAMDATRLTKTTFGGGTSEYMPPEQAKGDPVDGRGDLYSLGIVFYEMLTGRCPFEGGNPLSVIHSQVYDEPPKPREFNASIPVSVEAIILKLLAKEPAARFKNGLELVAKLASVDFKEPSKKNLKAKHVKQKPTITPDKVASNADVIKSKTKIKKPASADKPMETVAKTKLKPVETTVKKSEAKAPAVGESTTVKASEGVKSTKLKPDVSDADKSKATLLKGNKESTSKASKTKLKSAADGANKPKATLLKSNKATTTKMSKSTKLKKDKSTPPEVGKATTIKGSKATKLKPAKTKSVAPNKATVIKETPVMKASSASQDKKSESKQTRFKKDPIEVKTKQTQVKKTVIKAKAKQTQIKKSAGKLTSKKTRVKRADQNVASIKAADTKQPAVPSLTIEKDNISEIGQEAGNRRFRKFALIAAGLAVLGMVAAFAWSNYSNRYPFHYQFNSAVSTVGQAKVVREINLQTNGNAKVLVVALRVKNGQGDIEVRESIPKSLAASVKAIRFNRQPTRIINDDPVILWRLKAKKGGTNLIYRVNVNKK